MKQNKIISLYENFLNDVKRTRSNSMFVINETLNNHEIDFVFIGSILLSEYGYNRMTENIDILIDKKDLKIINFPDIKLNVYFSGDTIGKDSMIKWPNPRDIKIRNKDGYPIISLQKLIEFKLCLGLFEDNRMYNFNDIHKLILLNKLSKNLADIFRLDLKEKYLEIWNKTNYEKS